MEDNVLVEVNGLQKYFKLKGKDILQAVDGINLKIKTGETFGLVGESGCGKTTCGRTIMGLYEPTSGEIIFDGKDITKMSKAEKKGFTKNAQIIFQDPYSSLDPRMTVNDIIGEGILEHKLLNKSECKERVKELLELVGLNKEHANRFPHEFSGGQRQRIGIARALAVNPKFIVCDEPISALDVSIQAQIVNLLIKLQKELGLTYLFIAHDLSMVKHISDRVGVMYLGQLVEIASSSNLYANTMHPYTKTLLSAIPVPDPDIERNKKRVQMKGEIPSPINCTPSCRFSTRCIYATERCKNETPLLKEIKKDHFVACFLFE